MGDENPLGFDGSFSADSASTIRKEFLEIRDTVNDSFGIGREKVREIPAPRHIYMQPNVRGASSHFPIWNKESRRFGRRRPKKNTR